MQCFEKASLFAFGKSLRTLFATLLINGEITDAATIWDTFGIYFCDNRSYQLWNWPNIFEHLINPHHDYGLFLLGELLKESGKY